MYRACFVAYDVLSRLYNALCKPQGVTGLISPPTAWGVK